MKTKLSFLKKPAILFALLFSVFAFNLKAQTCVDVPNMDGTPGISTAPPGWTPYNSTPDIINGNGLWPGGGTYVVTEVNGFSTSGGEMGLFLHNGGSGGVNGFSESWSTVLTGLTIGLVYDVDVEWQQAALTNGGFDYDGVSGLRMWASNSGTAVNYTSSGGLSDVWRTETYTFTASATTETFIIGVIAGGASNAAIVVDGGAICVPGCRAGTTAPPLSATTINNTCPTSSVDLDALHTAGYVPNGTTLVWSTDNDSSDGLSSTVATPTAVTVAGTYYAYYYHAVDMCYSPVSAGVVFTSTVCCNAGSEAPKF
jgi:hypothetical protein